MNRARVVCRCLAVSVFPFLIMQCLPTGLGIAAEAALPPGHPYTKAFADLPLAFEPNRGQTDRAVRFLARGSGQTLFLKDREAVLLVGRKAVVRFDWLGSRPAAKVSGEDPLRGVSNYFLGRDPARWRTNIPQFGGVRFSGIYPGIDLVYYGNRRQLEYDLVLSPSTDPRQVRLRIRGADRIRISPEGDLVLSVAGGEMIQKKPLVYQMDGQKRQQVDGYYVLSGTDEVAFAVASYDARRPLVIDPVLVYSTYLGGSGDDSATAIAVDGSGNAYVAGYTASSDFPTAGNPPLQSTLSTTEDAFVAKLSADGSTLLYSTYLGGAKGVQAADAIAIDNNGGAYVAGYTTSSDFPVTQGAFQTAGPSNSGTIVGFVSKLSPSGSILSYSTFVGRTDTFVNGIAVDGALCAYVVGETGDSSLPTSATAVKPKYYGPEDAFVIKLNATGTGEIYGTFLGGSGGDRGFGIALDSSGDAYVAGSTNSLDFPVLNAIQATAPPSASGLNSGFVAKLNGDASAFIFSTYLGGAAGTDAYAIAVDGNGNAYVTGDDYPPSSGTNPFPLKNALQPALGAGGHAYLTKFDPSGALIYSTYLGGSGSDTGRAVGADSAGNAYVAGYTDSPDFPVVNGLPSSFSHPQWPVFKSVDGGTTWTAGTAGEPSGGVSALAVDPVTPSTLYSGTTGGQVYKSIDGGSHWTPSSTGLPGNGQINSLAIAPGNTAVLYAGSGAGVFESSNGGGSWSAANSGLTNLPVNSIAVDPLDSNTVYAATGSSSGSVFKSTNGGSSWTSVASSAVTFTAVVVNPSNSQDVYAGTSFGTVYYSSDKFQTTHTYNMTARVPEPPPAPATVWPAIHAFAIDPATGLLAAAIYSPWCSGSSSLSQLWALTTGMGCAGPGGTCAEWSVANEPYGAGVSAAVSPSGTVYVGTDNTILEFTGGGLSPQPIKVIPAYGPFVAIATDPSASNTLYVASMYPLGNDDAFLTVMNPTGAALVFSTFFGGSGEDTAQALAVDNNGNVWLTGSTSSRDLPTTPGVKQLALAGRLGAFVAKFSLPVPITVTTSPTGLAFSVDGTTYTSAQTFYWGVGDTHTISVTSSQLPATGTRYSFFSWSDGGTLSHSITVPAAAATYTATFGPLQYLLTLNTSPSAGGSITANPSSTDGYYDSGTSVQLTANYANNYLFTGWGSDLSGITNPQSLTMNAPHIVTANFSPGCDVNTDGVVNVQDVQLVIIEALGLAQPVNHGAVKVSDVQLVIKAALGLGCTGW